MYYRGASVAVLVYDVTVRETLTNGVTSWIEQLQKHCDTEDILLVLVGNKVDLKDLRAVEEKEAREYAGSIGAVFWETSAKTGHNVDELFRDICSRLEKKGSNNLSFISDNTMPRGRGLTVISSDNVLVDPPKPSRQCCRM